MPQRVRRTRWLVVTEVRTVLSPHLGYVATGAYERWWREVVEDVEAFLDGEPTRVLA